MRKNKVRRIYLVLLAIILITACTGCQQKEDREVLIENTQELNQVPTSSKQDIMTTEENIAETEVSGMEPEASKVEVEEAQADNEATQVESTDPEPEVAYEITHDDAKTIAEKGFLALQSLNAEEMIQYTNVGIFYYIGKGKETEEQELIDALNEILSETDFEGGYNNLGIIGWYAMLKNVEFYDIQPYPEDELGELNAYIAQDEGMFWDETRDIQYHIEKAYKLKVSYEGVEEEDTSNGNEPYVLVVCVDGEWQLDVCLTIMQELERSLEQLMEE